MVLILELLLEISVRADLRGEVTVLQLRLLFVVTDAAVDRAVDR